MPICTLRQKLAVLQHRQKQNRLHSQTIAEWQARTIAQFVASTVPANQGGKQIAAQAAKVKLRMEDESGAAEDDRPLEQVIEEGSVAENRLGSYEALSAGFGGART